LDLICFHTDVLNLIVLWAQVNCFLRVFFKTENAHTAVQVTTIVQFKIESPDDLIICLDVFFQNISVCFKIYLYITAFSKWLKKPHFIKKPITI